MVTRFQIAIAAVVVVMVILVILPSLNISKPNANSQKQLNLEYHRQELRRAGATTALVATNTDILTIENDGSARYSKLVGSHDEKTFAISSDEMKQLKGLIFDTGFMNIPSIGYIQKEGLTNVTEYALKVNADGSAKMINWVDPNSYNGTIPPIVINIGSTLDRLISKYI